MRHAFSPARGFRLSLQPQESRSNTRIVHNVGYNLRLALPLAGFFALFFITPLILLIFVSLHADPELKHFGFDQFHRFLGDPYSLKVLGQTLVIGAEVAALCLLLGYPLAWLFVRSPGWLRGALMLVILLPLLTSVVVRTFAWIVILGRLGIVNSTLITLGLIDAPLRLLYSEGGLVLALAQVHMPLMVLPLITALSRVDPNLADASAALGAGAWRTFLRITVPLTLAGIIAGCLLTYCMSLTAFITQTLIGGGQMLLMPGYIYQQAAASQDWPFAAAISVIFLVAVLAAVTVFNLLGRLAHE
jgi:putative spermidine/putrescine transport system permease protein